MMTNKHKNVPELRFKGFTDEWKLCALGELSSLRGGFAFSSEKFRAKGVPIVRISNILPTGEIGGDYVFYDEEVKDENYLLPNKAAVLAMSGATTGKVSILDNPQNKKIYQNQRVGYFTKKDSTDYGFVSTLVRSHLFINQLNSVLVAGAQPNVSSRDIDSFEFKVPMQIKEQQKIGLFFANLDHLITLHQRKLDLLKEQKKGFLQKMFPKNGETVPVLRFERFAGAWEQCRLSELATMNARIGWQNLRTSEFLDTGDYMLITGTDFKDDAIDFSGIHYVEKERFDQDKKIQIQNGSILITKDGTLGKVAYVEDLTMPATLNAGVFNVRVKDDTEVHSKYLFHYLKAPFLLKYAEAHSTGGTIKHLNQNVLVNFSIPLPNKTEQKKISNFFSHLDTLVILQQRKLDLLKEQKKGFLQKMFV